MGGRVKNYYIVVHRDVPVFVTSYQEMAEREARERSVDSAVARVVVASHCFYLDEVANIVLKDWTIPDLVLQQPVDELEDFQNEEPTTPDSRKACTCGPSNR